MNMLKRRAKVTAVAMCAVLAATVTPATAQTTEATTPITTTQSTENTANGSLDQLTKVLQLSTTAVGGLIVPFVQRILGAFDRLGCALRGESCMQKFSTLKPISPSEAAALAPARPVPTTITSSLSLFLGLTSRW